MSHETQEAQEAHECRRQSRLAAQAEALQADALQADALQADALQADALEVRPGAPHERGVG